MASRRQTHRDETTYLQQRVQRYLEQNSSPAICIFQNSKGCVLKVVGFGLYHHCDSLTEMGDLKQKALNKTLRDIGDMEEQSLVQQFDDSITQIKDCYLKSEEYFRDISNLELAKMFTMDACFILEFFTPCRLRDDDGMLGKTITDDILLLENQIPLFLLLKVMKLKYRRPGEAVFKFAEMLTNYLPFQTLLPFAIPREEIIPCLRKLLMAEDEGSKCHHLLHLLSSSIQELLSREKQPSFIAGMTPPLLYDAKDGESPRPLHYYLERLQDYNIKFKADNQVMFQPKWILSSILHLPQICLDKATEPVLGNLMEFAVKRRDHKLICDLMYLLRCIVKESNEHIFREQGIILGESAFQMTFSQRICTISEHFTDRPGRYGELIIELYRHCKFAPNRWISMFCKNFPWWIGVGSIVTLVFTIVIGLLQYFKKE